MASISALFERLGAPLRNIQWSWGAARPDGTVFLRVWQDETQSAEDGSRFIRLVNHGAYRGAETNLGYSERLQHLESLREGATGYAVICRAVDPHARPRSIESFGDREVMRLGKIMVIDGDEWGELAERVPVRSIRQG